MRPGMQTDAFFDVTGSATAISVIVYCLKRIKPASDADLPSIIALTLVGVWTARLGLLVGYRIYKLGHDSRMDKIKRQPSSFLIAWTMQGLWIFIITLPAQVLTASEARVQPTGLRQLLSSAGLLLWATGFIIECIADWQKLHFRLQPANKVYLSQFQFWVVCSAVVETHITFENSIRWNVPLRAGTESTLQADGLDPTACIVH